jgi:malate synthase
MTVPPGLEIVGPVPPDRTAILSDEALALAARLQRELGPRRAELLAARAERQARLDAGAGLGYLEETRAIREGDWQVAPAPPALQDRRVEITGPAEPKMMINALNSGARVFMCDLEDALSPTWTNVLDGQQALRDAVRHELEFTSTEGKQYRLDDEIATLIVRPRGWHLVERHVTLNGEPLSGGLFDLALHLTHNAHAMVARGSGPFLYLPKLESHLEARLWNDAFLIAQEELGLPVGTIRATVLIETLPAAFEMEEILYELREHSAGLNAGRWDYIFSAIKKLREREEAILPDRSQVTMAVPFMRAYTQMLVRACHRRGAHAIGGMAAFIPSRRDAAVNEVAFAKVREDKEREAQGGCDGTWVAHPDLVPLAMEIFDAVLGERPNQIDRLREDVDTDPARLLALGETPGEITEAGVRTNLMEDAATAEISRAQLWQWLRFGITLADGRPFSRELYAALRDEEVERIGGRGEGRIGEAVDLLDELVLQERFEEFLTVPAYARLA